jgi:acetyl esterase
MALDPGLARVRAERIAAGAKPVSERTVDEARAEEARNLPPDTIPHEALTAPGPAGVIDLRVYRRAAADVHPLPVLVWFFGGGWVLGSLAATAPLCAALAERAGCAVISVGYRRAPEHRFPAAVDDCLAGTRWLRDHADQLGLDGDRVAVGGASAGGTLAAIVALLEKEREPALVLQVLVYPVTAYHSGTASLTERGDPYFLDGAAVDWAWSHYLPTEADTDDPRISPLRAPDLRGLPRAVLVLAGQDPLHDEGLLYAERLEAEGIGAEVIDFPEMVHGFLALSPDVDAAEQARTLIGLSLRGAFGGH